MSVGSPSPDQIRVVAMPVQPVQVKLAQTPAPITVRGAALPGPAGAAGPAGPQGPPGAPFVPAVARAYRNAAFVLASGQANTWLKVPVDTKSFDTGTIFDTANGRLLIPAAGYYQANGQIFVQSPAVGTRAIVGIYQNGTQMAVAEDECSGANQYPGPVVADVLHCAAGDAIELWMYSNNLVTLLTGGYPNLNYLSIAKVG